MLRRFSVVALLLALSLAAAAQSQQAQEQAQNVQVTNGPTVENVTGNSAIIAWTTNVNASSELRYGTDQNKLDQNATAPWGGTTHRVTLGNLQPNTTYYYQVKSGQGQGTGTGALSAVAQFKTTGDSSAQAAQGQPSQPAPDQAAQAQSQPSGQAHSGEVQVVAGPIPQQLTDTSALIWWETTGPSESIIKYGTDPNKLDQMAQEPHGQQSHKVNLKNLQPDTTYHIALVKPDGSMRATGNFKTESANFAQQQNKLRITNGPVIEYLSDNEAMVAWTTNMKSSSVVRYGTDPNNLGKTAEAPWGQDTHRVSIKGLQPNTKYWFQIESSQAQGTGALAQSQKFPFQTVNQGQAALRIALQ